MNFVNACGTKMHFLGTKIVKRANWILWVHITCDVLVSPKIVLSIPFS